MLKQSNSALYSHYDDLMVYLFIDTRYTIDQMLKWEEPALFVPETLLESTFRPYAKIIYRLPDSRMLGIIININTYKSAKRQHYNIANKIVAGVKIPLHEWFDITNNCPE